MTNNERRRGVVLPRWLVWTITALFGVVQVAAIGWAAKIDHNSTSQGQDVAVLKANEQERREQLTRIEQKMDRLTDLLLGRLLP